MKRIGIVGPGLIGGSLALALKDEFDIIAVEEDSETVKNLTALGIKCADTNALKGAQVIFVCVPLKFIREEIENIYNVVGDSAVITDVGSVKSNLYGLKGRIVGGHPMAGTEKSGFLNADKNLFYKHTYILTRYENTKNSDVLLVKEVLAYLNVNIIEMEAEQHDKMAAASSHLPHAVAYTLAGLTDSDNYIVGGGFCDTTRIALSSEEFWTDVFKLNKENVLGQMRRFIDEFTTLEKLIENDDFTKVKERLKKSRIMREKIKSKESQGADKEKTK